MDCLSELKDQRLSLSRVMNPQVMAARYVIHLTKGLMETPGVRVGMEEPIDTSYVYDVRCGEPRDDKMPHVWVSQYSWTIENGGTLYNRQDLRVHLRELMEAEEKEERQKEEANVDDE